MEEMFSVVKSLHTHFLRILGAVALVIGWCPARSRHNSPRPLNLHTMSTPKPGNCWTAPSRRWAGSIPERQIPDHQGPRLFFQDGDTAGMEPYESWVLYPDKRRFSYGKTKPVILINNGDKGWELDRYGLIAQPDQQLQGWILSNRYSLENLLRLRINEPGVLIQIGKADFVDNVPTQGIEIIAPGGTSVRLDLHRQTLVPSRISYRVQERQGRRLG